jgi:general secretion pathway protein I
MNSRPRRPYGTPSAQDERPEARSRQRKLDRLTGFTLIEVMIALVVFAVAGFAVSSRVGEVVNQTFSLERRTVAHWIAMNQLTRMRMTSERDEAALPTGRSRERVMMGGREWMLEIEIANTSHPLLRRVELSVFAIERGDEVGPIDHLAGFLGSH